MDTSLLPAPHRRLLAAAPLFVCCVCVCRCADGVAADALTLCGVCACVSAGCARSVRCRCCVMRNGEQILWDFSESKESFRS
eukprot:SAG31_NODE_34371_length_333_cov_1.628205_1_plen_81_part_01